MKDYTTRKELIEILQRFSKELGKTPSRRDWISYKKKPSISTITRRFNSWYAFCEEASLKKNHPGKTLPKGVSSRNQLIAIYKRSAKKRGYTYNLTEKEAISFFKSPCCYCGSPPSNIHNPHNLLGSYVYNGIDRVDNTKGYEIDNCVSCCKFCNVIKNTSTPEKFQKDLKQYYNLLKKKFE